MARPSTDDGAASSSLASDGDGSRRRTGERRHRHVRRVPGRGGRPADRRYGYAVHQLHELRAPLHHRACPSPTTGRPPPWPASPCARRASASTTIPADRRFHAQPNACPVCGPQLRCCRTGATGAQLAEVTGDTRSADYPVADTSTVAQAAAALRPAPCWRSRASVATTWPWTPRNAGPSPMLRRRKSRDDKPFAVMVPDAGSARRLVELDRRRRWRCSPRPAVPSCWRREGIGRPSPPRRGARAGRAGGHAGLLRRCTTAAGRGGPSPGHDQWQPVRRADRPYRRRRRRPGSARWWTPS